MTAANSNARRQAGDTPDMGTNNGDDNAVVETVVTPGIIGRTINKIVEHPFTAGLVVGGVLVVAGAGFLAYRRFAPAGAAGLVGEALADNVTPISENIARLFG